MVAPAGQPRRVLHYKPPSSATAMGSPPAAWNSAGCARPAATSRRPYRASVTWSRWSCRTAPGPRPLRAIVVPLDVPARAVQPSPGDGLKSDRALPPALGR
jgi:hypothetical protein